METEVPKETKLTDLVETKDYEGYTFNYLSLELGINNTSRFVQEMWVEELTGDVLNDAVYNRNLFLTERLNIVVETTPVSDVQGTLQNAVTAGDNVYHMVGAYKGNSMGMATGGYVRDWNTLDIEYDKPWWSLAAAEKLAVCGYQFMMSGNILISEIDDTLAMIYNKNVGINYNLEDIYTLVKEKRWTVDKFIEMTEAVANDLSGDGEMKVGDDLFGYVQDPASMNNNWFFSSDLMNGIIDDEGTFSHNIDVERVQNLIDKLSPYFQTDNIYTGLDLYEGLNYFTEDKIFVYAIILRNLELLRDMDSDYGVIPYPLYDQSQENYLTHVGSASPILTIPVLNTEDDERLADILTAMAISAREMILPAYYETMLKEKIARDPTSAEMLDIIVESKTYDITYLIGVGLISIGAGLLTRGSTNFASSLASQEKSINTNVQKTVTALLEAGETQNK